MEDLHQTEKKKRKKKNESKRSLKALQLLNIYFRNTVTPSFPLILKANSHPRKINRDERSKEFFSTQQVFNRIEGGFSSDFLLPVRVFPSNLSSSDLLRSKEFPDDGKITARKSWRRRRKRCPPGKTLFRTFERSDSTIFEFLDDTWGEPHWAVLFEQYRLSSIWSTIS